MNRETDIGLIFDMDGTLLDNNPYHFSAWKSLCLESGKKLTLEEYKNHISGINSEQTIKYLFGEHLTTSEIQELKIRKDTYYKHMIAAGVKPLDGLTDLLRQAQLAAIPMAVASSASPQNILHVLDALRIGPFFTAVADSTMVPRGKPAPDLFILASQMIGVPPRKCIVFEDSFNGIRGAKQAGMFTIGISTSHDPEELIRMADRVLSDYRSLTIPILEKMLHSHDIH